MTGFFAKKALKFLLYSVRGVVSHYMLRLQAVMYIELFITYVRF